MTLPSKCTQIEYYFKCFLLFPGGITLVYDMDQHFPVCYPVFPFPHRFYTKLWNGKNNIKVLSASYLNYSNLSHKWQNHIKCFASVCKAKKRIKRLSKSNETSKSVWKWTKFNDFFFWLFEITKHLGRLILGHIVWRLLEQIWNRFILSLRGHTSDERDTDIRVSIAPRGLRRSPYPGLALHILLCCCKPLCDTIDSLRRGGGLHLHRFLVTNATWRHLVDVFVLTGAVRVGSSL